ncbi:hypothetical protein UY3_16952 [Chelonia mydas]|uniref:Uncharacterized protein n=1 Tax=Chelonia mydas TaxID=8469 RepID=M7ASS2_CHEMY|nr:hypothetical protein UY3_16952 [Chelonia mydas]
MALAYPKAMLGDLLYPEEPSLDNEKCHHFLSANIIAVGVRAVQCGEDGINVNPVSRDKVGEVTSFIGPTSVGARDKHLSHIELFFTSGKDTQNVIAKYKLEQII